MDDEFYKVQLNGYALIGEQVGFNPVDKLLLCYYEPHGGILEIDQLDELLKDNGFNMPFTAHIMELELDPVGVVKPLLKEVRRIGDMEEIPEGGSECKDCRLVEELVGRAGKSDIKYMTDT